MSRTKVGRDAATAFWEGEPFKLGNTRVSITDRVVSLYLHNSLIAERVLSHTHCLITLAGWDTVTTRDRLQAVVTRVGARIYRRAGQTYLDDAGSIQEMSPDWWYVAGRAPTARER